MREKLGLTGDKADITYDKELEDAVAKFQKKHGLPATGSLTTATIDAMNGPRRDRDADIIMANLERWRWMPHDLGKTRVVVNIPDYHAAALPQRPALLEHAHRRRQAEPGDRRS